MHGLISNSRHNRQGQRHYRRRGRHFRGWSRAAVLRAWTSARIILRRPISAANLNSAADMTGANKTYVAAMLTIMAAEDEALEMKVLSGEAPVLEAAASVKSRAALVKALRQANPTDLLNAGRAVGPEFVFDSIVLPALASVSAKTEFETVD
jgi:hypothetical protein